MGSVKNCGVSIRCLDVQSDRVTDTREEKRKKIVNGKRLNAALFF